MAARTIYIINAVTHLPVSVSVCVCVVLCEDGLLLKYWSDFIPFLLEWFSYVKWWFLSPFHVLPLNIFFINQYISLNNQYKIPLVYISPQGWRYLPSQGIHTFGQCIYFIDCLLRKRLLIKKDVPSKKMWWYSEPS